MRDEERIEELLRSAWTLAPPDGMKDRVLRNARIELADPARRAPVPRGRWRFALAGVSAAVVLAANFLDASLAARMTKLTMGGSVGLAEVSVPRILQAQHQSDRLLALRMSPGLSGTLMEENNGSILGF